jgi:plasmid stabilization system protein ParE
MAQKRDVIVTWGAQSDIRNALAYYGRISPALPQRFQSEFERCIRLLSNPGPLHAIVFDQFRQMGMRKFPFLIHYEIVDKKIEVAAVWHAKRAPRSWRSRSGGPAIN